MGHVIHQAVPDSRADAPGIPGRILQCAESCELPVQPVWIDQLRTNCAGTRSQQHQQRSEPRGQSIWIPAGGASAKADSVCAEVLFLNSFLFRVSGFWFSELQ